MSDGKGKYCSCGFPQSSPVPHEHDRSENAVKMSEHTEWKVVEICDETVVWDSKSREIICNLTVNTPPTHKPTARKRAEFIVRACNGYDDLLDVCKNIEANLSGSDCFPERVKDSLRRARAAIKKAEVQP